MVIIASMIMMIIVVGIKIVVVRPLMRPGRAFLQSGPHQRPHYCCVVCLRKWSWPLPGFLLMQTVLCACEKHVQA